MMVDVDAATAATLDDDGPVTAAATGTLVTAAVGGSGRATYAATLAMTGSRRCCVEVDGRFASTFSVFHRASRDRTRQPARCHVHRSISYRGLNDVGGRSTNTDILSDVCAAARKSTSFSHDAE